MQAEATIDSCSKQGCNAFTSQVAADRSTVMPGECCGAWIGLPRAAAAAVPRAGARGVDQPMSSIRRAAMISVLRASPCS